MTAFPGVAKLEMPPYILSKLSNITLPSRLAMLGRRAFAFASLLFPQQFGNSVCGFAPVFKASSSSSSSSSSLSESKLAQLGKLTVCGFRIKFQLHLLPWTFSRAMARTWIFVFALFCLISAFLFFYLLDLTTLYVGQVWMLGTACSFIVCVALGTLRRAKDGVMVFCRSLAAPDIEEYMFSYAWKHSAEDIRTLARGLHDAGVGVWIDVVKLNPGVEIRPTLRTIVAKVFKVVIFLTPAYCASPNCCVELIEAVQTPAKCIFCIIRPVNVHVLTYLQTLKAQGATVCVGLSSLITLLDVQLQDTDDFTALTWWKRQSLAGVGVPAYLSPQKWTHIPKFATWAPIKLHLKNGIDCGPLYLTGDLSEAGIRVRHSILLILALLSLVFNWGQIFYIYHSQTPASRLDYAFLVSVALCNLGPFLSWEALIDTRVVVHKALRPLLASHALGGGIKVKLHGDSKHNTAVRVLHHFLWLIGHLAPDNEPDRYHDKVVHVHVLHTLEERDALFGKSAAARSKLAKLNYALAMASSDDGSGIMTTTMIETTRHRASTGNTKQDKEIAEAMVALNEATAALRNNLYVWNGVGDPFSIDEIGSEMMRFLVLVSAWENDNLADSLFSAIGIKAVQLMHEGVRGRAKRARVKLRAVAAFVLRSVREKRLHEKEAMLKRLSTIRHTDKKRWIQQADELSTIADHELH